MAHHHYEGPKDKTNPLMYIPVGIIAVALVVVVFSSGVMRGMHAGSMTESKAPVARTEAVNVRALAQPTDDLVQQGRQLYSVNCASCHGEQGFGDGSKGADLNPPPRNFHTPPEEWTNGASVGGMWETLANGIAGTSMSAYSLLPGDERIALIHYVRDAFVENPPEITPEEVTALPGPTGAQGDGAVIEAAPADDGPSIPVELAMMKMAQQYDIRPVRTDAPAGLKNMPGSDLYGTHCASCHGPAGTGSAGRRVLMPHPYIRLAIPPFSAESEKVSDFGGFARTVTDSTPGNRVHGFATLTEEQLRQLHRFVGALAREGMASR